MDATRGHPTNSEHDKQHQTSLVCGTCNTAQTNVATKQKQTQRHGYHFLMAWLQQVEISSSSIRLEAVKVRSYPGLWLRAWPMATSRINIFRSSRRGPVVNESD